MMTDLYLSFQFPFLFRRHKHVVYKNKTMEILFYLGLISIINGAELAGATGARAPVLFLPRPEILGHILYVLSRFSGPK